MIKAPIFLLILLSFSSFSQEHATIESSHLKLIIHDTEKVEIHHSYTVTVYEESEKFASTYFDYTDQFRKIKKVEMIVKDKLMRKVKKLTKKDGVEFSTSRSFQLDDSKYFVLNPKYELYPYTVEVTVEVELNGFLNLPTWIPRSTYNTNVLESDLEVIAMNNYQLRIYENKVNPATVQKISEGVTSYQWSVRDLPAVKKSVDSKVFFDQQPKVYLAPSKFELDGHEGNFDDWKQFGNWFLKLNEGRDEILSQTKKFLDDLDFKTTDEYVKEIYSYMQSRTRYVSIQLGIGGFRSMMASTIDEKGYGECKGLTNYMKAMLSYKDISSNYILVRAGKEAPEVLSEFPSNQFNHVFLGVPTSTDTILLECTSQTIPPNYIGSFTDDREALWIQSNNSQLIHTPIYSESENIISKKAQATLDESGGFLLKVSNNYEGVFFDDAGIYLNRSTTQVEDYNYNQFSYENFTIKSFDFEDNRQEAEFATKFELNVKNYAKNVSGDLILPVNILEPIKTFITSDRYTKYSNVSRGFTLTEDVEVELPTNYYSANLPAPLHIETVFGTFGISMSVKGNSILIMREVQIFKGKYEGSLFDDFNHFIDEMSKAESQKIIIQSRT